MIPVIERRDDGRDMDALRKEDLMEHRFSLPNHHNSISSVSLNFFLGHLISFSALAEQ